MSEVLIIVIYFCELSYSGDKCSETNDFCQEEKRNLYQEGNLCIDVSFSIKLVIVMEITESSSDSDHNF